MYLVFHGGKCCGIKTIYGFSAPNEILAARDKTSPLNHDKQGNTVGSDIYFFTDGAPKETRLKRFERLIDFCRRERPHGLIEVALATIDVYLYSDDGEEYLGKIAQDALWGPLLEERGFKEVTKFKNSNTGRNITVYHFVY